MDFLQSPECFYVLANELLRSHRPAAHSSLCGHLCRDVAVRASKMTKLSLESLSRSPAVYWAVLQIHIYSLTCGEQATSLAGG